MIFIKKVLFFIFLFNISIPNQVNNINFNDFGFSLFRKINLNNESDFVISPISIVYALIMTNAGASGQTSDEILSTLNLVDSDLNNIILDQELKLYIEDSKNNGLIFGNSIWIQNDKCYMPNENYVDYINSTFNGKASFVNFHNDRLSIIDSINIWVNNMTNGLIENMVSKEDIKRTTKQVLLNTLYFKSNWQFVFDSSKTKFDDFFLDNKKIKVPMMNHKNRYFHYQGDDFHLLDIPYERHNISMLFLLPNDNIRLDSLIENINFNILEDYLDKSKFEMGNISVPKFESELSISLKDHLKSMGMKIPFEPGYASFDKFWDYTGTCKKNPPKHYIDIINHKVNINVKEGGTEAAAATAVVINRVTSIDPFLEPFEFKANKPFLYAIYDKKSKNILFLGKYTGYKE